MWTVRSQTFVVFEFSNFEQKFRTRPDDGAAGSRLGDCFVVIDSRVSYWGGGRNARGRAIGAATSGAVPPYGEEGGRLLSFLCITRGFVGKSSSLRSVWVLLRNGVIRRPLLLFGCPILCFSWVKRNVVWFDDIAKPVCYNEELGTLHLSHHWVFNVTNRSHLNKILKIKPSRSIVMIGTATQGCERVFPFISIKIKRSRSIAPMSDLKICTRDYLRSLLSDFANPRSCSFAFMSELENQRSRWQILRSWTFFFLICARVQLHPWAIWKDAFALLYAHEPPAGKCFSDLRGNPEVSLLCMHTFPHVCPWRSEEPHSRQQFFTIRRRTKRMVVGATECCNQCNVLNCNCFLNLLDVSTFI